MSNPMLFNHKIYKTPLQIQLLTTKLCNRKCAWCIEKGAMSKNYSNNTKRYMENLKTLLLELKHLGISANVILTGGEPTLNEDLALNLLDTCGDLMPKSVYLKNEMPEGNKVGINSNGDNDSLIFKHPRLDYINISFIDKMYPAQKYNASVPVRLQTVCRKTIFNKGFKSIQHFIKKAIKEGYDSVCFRQLVGDSIDKLDVFTLEEEASYAHNWKYMSYKIDAYDLWVKYIYQNHLVCFKRQDLSSQRVLERRYGGICSVVFWPDGKVTKSWNYEDALLF